MIRAGLCVALMSCHSSREMRCTGVDMQKTDYGEGFSPPTDGAPVKMILPASGGDARLQKRSSFWKNPEKLQMCTDDDDKFLVIKDDKLKNSCQEPSRIPKALLI